MRRNLDKGVDLGKVERADADAALGRLTWHGELAAAVDGADLVIEAVPEDMALKLETFARGRAPRAGARAASPPTPRRCRSPRWRPPAAARERFAGMHFFNPVHVMKLLELVRGLETSEETLATLAAVGERMGKEVVRVNEAPGFVTTRINALIGNEAFRMLQEGVASAEDIDRALKLGLNHPMGPFELVDLVGLDVRLSILEFLHATLGEAYRPNNLLVQHVRAGRLGRKTGRGVYAYDEDGRRA